MKQFIIENWFIIVLATALLISCIKIYTLSQKNKANIVARERNKRVCIYFINLLPTEQLKKLSSDIRTGLSDVKSLKCRGEATPKELICYAQEPDLYERIANIIDDSIRRRK